MLKQDANDIIILVAAVVLYIKNKMLMIITLVVAVATTDWSLVQRSPTDSGASLCVIKKPRTRRGYSPARGLQNTNPQWVVAPIEKSSGGHSMFKTRC